MKVLVACEFSGTVREAFRKRGHNAWSCDLREADDLSVYHIQGDCLPLLGEKWDLLIAHPPCTHLSLSGIRWLKDHWVKRKTKPDRWHDGGEKRKKQIEAVEFFRALLDCNIPMRCLENPRSLATTLVAPMSQTIHPWQYGHPEKKTTWLWLRGLPPLVGTNNVHAQMLRLPQREQERIHWMAPGPERERLRSITFQGIADAMAKQWGGGDPMNDPMLR